MFNISLCNMANKTMWFCVQLETKCQSLFILKSKNGGYLFFKMYYTCCINILNFCLVQIDFDFVLNSL